jgi:hypothetical protein
MASGYNGTHLERRRTQLMAQQIRENHTKQSAELDLDDVLLVEGPAKGAHNGRLLEIDRGVDEIY